MSEHGATLQTYTQELVKCLEDLRNRRKEISELVTREQAEKNAVEKNIKLLTEKLEHINGNLEKHKEIYDNYEKTIKETELGFKKITETSQVLLTSAQKEAVKLDSYKKIPSCDEIPDAHRSCEFRPKRS